VVSKKRGDKGMTKTTQLNKELFLSIAKAFGLDINDPHIEELYAYVQKILPTLKRIEELDLTDTEPVMLPPALAEGKGKVNPDPALKRGALGSPDLQDSSP
jgi:hypothetical protein